MLVGATPKWHFGLLYLPMQRLPEFPERHHTRAAIKAQGTWFLPQRARITVSKSGAYDD